MSKQILIELVGENETGYVWDDDQWDRFLADMEFVTKTKKPYFLGSIIFKSGKTPNTWDHFSDCKIVIDGQQRLTTLMIFFKVRLAISMVFCERRGAKIQHILPAKRNGWKPTLHTVSAQSQQCWYMTCSVAVFIESVSTVERHIISIRSTVIISTSPLNSLICTTFPYAMSRMRKWTESTVGKMRIQQNAISC